MVESVVKSRLGKAKLKRNTQNIVRSASMALTEKAKTHRTKSKKKIPGRPTTPTGKENKPPTRGNEGHDRKGGRAAETDGTWVGTWRSEGMDRTFPKDQTTDMVREIRLHNGVTRSEVLDVDMGKKITKGQQDRVHLGTVMQDVENQTQDFQDKHGFAQDFNQQVNQQVKQVRSSDPQQNFSDHSGRTNHSHNCHNHYSNHNPCRCHIHTCHSHNNSKHNNKHTPNSPGSSRRAADQFYYPESSGSTRDGHSPSYNPKNYSSQPCDVAHNERKMTRRDVDASSATSSSSIFATECSSQNFYCA